jgi:hypothetical protein
MLLFSQAKRLTDCTEQDVALMVALPVSIAPQELNEAQQELDWPSSLAALETASRSDDARLAVEAIEERLQGDSDELAMVIELAALKDGQALLVDEFDITAAQLRQLIAHAADREPAAVQ